MTSCEVARASALETFCQATRHVEEVQHRLHTAHDNWRVAKANLLAIAPEVKHIEDLV